MDFLNRDGLFGMSVWANIVWVIYLLLVIWGYAALVDWVKGLMI